MPDRRLLKSAEMRRVFLLLTISFLQINGVWSRGIGGHLSRTEKAPKSPEEQRERTFSSGSSSGASTKNEKERRWAAMLSTGWTSREVQYGVDQTGDHGAYTTELTLRLQNLTLGGWWGFGTGNDYQEWDLSASYTFYLGSVFVTPGYNFSYQRSVGEHQASELEKKADACSVGRAHREAQHRRERGSSQVGPLFEAYGHEVFLFLGTSVVPFVTPGIFFVSDVVNVPGSYLEVRLDGEIRVHKEVFELQPYVSLGINLGYNTADYYGWNNFQIGLLASWKVNRFVSLFGGINYSVALTALRQIGQENEVWASGGVTFSY
jgi:hypothetical protein